MKLSLRIVLYGTLVSISCAGLGATPKEEFNDAQAHYAECMKAKDLECAAESAETAYKVGKGLFGDDDVNTANLGINLGRTLNRLNRHAEAERVLEHSLDIMERRLGKDAVELVDVYFELGRSVVETDVKRAVGYMDKASKLVDGQPGLTRGSVNLAVAIELSARGAVPPAREFYDRSHTGFLESVGPTDARTALTSFNLGKYAVSDRKYAEARDFLQSALAVYSIPHPENREMELRTRTLLSEALDGLGDTEGANEQARIIGSQAAATPTADYLPLYKVQPSYPAKALRKRQAGWVIVEFTVDENGRTSDQKVVESSDEIFEAPAVQAARQFRYAPRFENGVAVATEHVRNKIDFDLNGLVPQRGAGRMRR